MLRRSDFIPPQTVQEATSKNSANHVEVWQMQALCDLLAQVGEVEGEVVDLGCGEGKSSRLLQVAIAGFELDKELYCYDAFPTEPISTLECVRKEVVLDFEIGEEKVRETFAEWGLEPPIIVPGWFQDTLKTELPEHIAFAHIDVGQKEALLTALPEIYTRLSPGAIVCVEGYGFGMAKCVQPAVDAFLRLLPEEIELTVSGIQAAFKKMSLEEALGTIVDERGYVG